MHNFFFTFRKQWLGSVPAGTYDEGVFGPCLVPSQCPPSNIPTFLTARGSFQQGWLLVVLSLHTRAALSLETPVRPTDAQESRQREGFGEHSATDAAPQGPRRFSPQVCSSDVFVVAQFSWSLLTQCFLRRDRSRTAWGRVTEVGPPGVS